RNGLVPTDEIAVGVVRTAVERLPPLLRPPLGDLTPILRTDHASGHGAGATTLRESTATEEEARAPVPLQHHGAALVTCVLRRFRRLPIALERPSELTRLGMIFTGDERPEEAAFRHEPPAAVGAPLRRQSGQVMRLGDQAFDLDGVQRLLEWPIELAEHAPP